MASFLNSLLVLAIMIVALATVLGVAAAGCGATVQAATTTSTAEQSAATEAAQQTPEATLVADATSAAIPTTTATSSSGTSNALFDSSTIHEITVSFAQEDFDAMIETYKTSGDKDWIEATVTIDGIVYTEVGMRLKGNSSIMGLRNGGKGRGPSANVSADSPETLPWLIRLDKNVDGQNCSGLTDIVIRSNTSKTSLNEAVALRLLDMAGLASQQASACRFSVNGSDATLRLVVELPNDEWMEEHFGSAGALYKAEASGDYGYRGTDPDAYADVFDQEAGKHNADLTPLIEFLDFINNADDATFTVELPKRVDIDAFATYLAMEDLIGNFDDIDGPGNNSYLYYDPASGIFTIVPWDHNLAFGGVSNWNGAAGAAAAGIQTPGVGPNAGRQPGQALNTRGKSNILVERFHANPEFEAIYQEKRVELNAMLYDSGAAQDVLDEWVQVLKGQASDLVDASTVDQEAAKIAQYFDAE